MSIDLSQFHQVFFEESFEGLDAMESALMELDPSDIDSETINTIFRAAHSIKGGSATFGFSIVADFTHVLETLLDEVRAGNRGITQDDVDLFLQSVDCLRELLNALQAEEQPDSQQSETLKAAFEAILKGESTGPVDVVSAPLITESAQTSTVVEEIESESAKVWTIRFIPYADMLRTGNEPLRMFRELADLGQVHVEALVDKVPIFPQMEPEACYLGWQITYSGTAKREEIDEVFEWVADDSEIVITEGELATAEGLSTATNGAWDIYFKPGADVMRTGNEPLRIFRELADAGSLKARADVSEVPGWSELDGETCHLSWSLQLSDSASREQIDEAFEWVADDSEITIRAAGVVADEASLAVEPQPAPTVVSEPPEISMPATVAAPSMAPKTEQSVADIAQKGAEPAVEADSGQSHKPQVQTKPSAKKVSTESSSIRVGIDKIDSLINMVGELVITQSMLGQLGADFEMSNMPKLLEGLSQLEQNTRELQESVMRIRMLPISFAFNRFPRMVRDLSRRLDKKIDLVLLGEQTELDKTVMEKIGDPLVHLVRNSVDHGIESPQERLAAGKSESGEILLKAYHQSGNVVIEISDDGKGLNREKLLGKAVENGLVAEKDAAIMSDDQVHDLIFQPGFSTAKEVSDVSGRGVGMDVVRRNIQELNGSVEITSEEGKGSRITIRLPLTLAILDGQLVRVGTHTYIFPLMSVVESIHNHQDMMSNIAGSYDVFKLRDEYVPVIRLFELFGIEPDHQTVDDSILVVVECDGEKVGIVVDELEAQQQVVIKSLENNYRRVEGISGATILGDGTVALILDIPGLVKLAGINHQMRSRVMNLAASHQSVKHIA